MPSHFNWSLPQQHSDYWILHLRSKVQLLQYNSTVTNPLHDPNKTMRSISDRERETDRKILVIGNHIMFVRSLIVILKNWCSCPLKRPDVTVSGAEPCCCQCRYCCTQTWTIVLMEQKCTLAKYNGPNILLYFDVLLTVHLSIILVLNQLNAQILIL